MTEQEFCQVVAQTLKGDHNDLRKEAIILRAHREALATPSQPDPQSRGQAFDGEGEGVRDALERILSCVDANGDGCYDTVEMVAGTKQNGQIVFKGSFITECVRARAALSEAREAGALADDSAPS